MKVLLIYPETLADNFWSGKSTIKRYLRQNQHFLQRPINSISDAPKRLGKKVS